MRRIASLVTALTLIANTAGCSWFQNKEAAVKQAAVNCAKQDLGQTVASAGESLLLTVVSIIASGGVNWTADLAALETKYGAEAVECAANIAEALFRTAPVSTSPDAGVAPATGDDDAAAVKAAHDRVEQYLNAKHVTFAQ